MEPDTRTHRDQAEELLDGLLGLDEPERARALEELCEQHPELARVLRDRFELYRRMLAAKPGADRRAPPQKLGEFELLRELGRGGMGVVYLARQRRGGTERQVALKLVLDRGLFSPQARIRFEREAAAAFRLDHPAICPVLDLGEVDDTPYLAMRYVPGATLASHIADARRHGGPLELPAAAPPDSSTSSSRSSTPTSTDRVGTIVTLIEQVAHALHAAHDAGLIHRDVKPGNIMVTPDGAPVLLDFGLVRDDNSTDARLTMTGQPIGTPAYMSPEQISPKGRPLDRTTDVYSLGATLFEALTLRPPFQARTREELFRRILEDSPPDPRKHAPAVTRDLAIVLGAALDKDPARRYASALEFAEDLRRARLRQPILARPTGPVRRLYLWAQRNRLASAILLLLAFSQIAIVILAINASRSADAAEQQRSRAMAHLASAREAVAKLTQTASLHLADVPWLEPVRRELFERALTLHDGFIELEGPEPQLRLDAARSRRQAGNLHRLLGDLDAAERRLTRARETLEPLVADGVDGAVEELAAVHVYSARLAQLRGDSGGAERGLQHGIARYRESVAHDPESVDARLNLGRALHELADTRVAVDATVTARAAVDEAVAIFGGLPEDTTGIAVDRARALCTSALLRQMAGELGKADEEYRGAAKELSGHLEKTPHDQGARSLLGTTHLRHGKVYRARNRLPKEAGAYDKARQESEELTRLFPAVQIHRLNLGTSLLLLGDNARRRGDDEASANYQRQAIQVLESLVADASHVPGYLADLASAHIGLGNALRHTAPEEAVEHHRTALALFQQAMAKEPDVVRHLDGATGAALSLGSTLGVIGRTEASHVAMAQARGYAERLVELRPNVAQFHGSLAMLLQNAGWLRAEAGNLAAASELLRGSVAARQRTLEIEPDDTLFRSELVLTLTRLGWVEDRRGSGGDAWRSAQRFLASWGEQGRRELERQLRSRYQLGCLLNGIGASLLRAGDAAAARAPLDDALKTLDTEDGGPWNTSELLLCLLHNAQLARLNGETQRIEGLAGQVTRAATRLEAELPRWTDGFVRQRVSDALPELVGFFPDDAAITSLQRGLVDR